MTKIRIFELAADLGVESEHLIQALRQMDVRVKSHHPVVIRAGPYQGGSLVLSLELDY